LKTHILIAKNRDAKIELSSQLAGPDGRNMLIPLILINDFEIEIEKSGKE